MDTIKYLYISINDFTNASNNGFVAAFSESTLSKDIIARIQYQGLIQKDGLYNFWDDDTGPAQPPQRTSLTPSGPYHHLNIMMFRSPPLVLQL